MGAFGRRQVALAKVAAHVFELPPEAFADTNPDKPTHPVKIGLRLVAEQRFTKARSEAAKEAWRIHPDEGDEPNRVDFFNHKLTGLIVAYAACEPDDAMQPFFGQQAEDKVFRVLTSHGIRRVYDEFEAFATASNPTAPEATDEDLDMLADGLMSGEMLASISIERARRVRRLLKAALEEATANL